MNVKFVSGRNITWDDSLYTAAQISLTNNYDLGAAQSRISSMVAPYLDGESYYAQTLAPRDIMLEYLLISSSMTLRDAFIQTLKTAFNPQDGLGLLTLTMPSGALFSLWCIINGEPVCMTGSGRWQETQTVQVNLRAPYPFFFNPVQKSSSLTSFSGGLSFPFSTPWTFGLASTSLVVTNAGNAPTPCVITFHGDITNPRIDNLTTLKYIKATMTLNAGELLRVNTANGQHTVEYIVGSSNTNGFQYLDSDSEFFWLMPGDNLISFSSSGSRGASAYCTVEYFDQFIGV